MVVAVDVSGAASDCQWAQWHCPICIFACWSLQGCITVGCGSIFGCQDQGIVIFDDHYFKGGFLLLQVIVSEHSGIVGMHLCLLELTGLYCCWLWQHCWLSGTRYCHFWDHYFRGIHSWRCDSNAGIH